MLHPEVPRIAQSTRHYSYHTHPQTLRGGMKAYAKCSTIAQHSLPLLLARLWSAAGR